MTSRYKEYPIIECDSNKHHNNKDKDGVKIAVGKRTAQYDFYQIEGRTFKEHSNFTSKPSVINLFSLRNLNKDLTVNLNDTKSTVQYLTLESAKLLRDQLDDAIEELSIINTTELLID